MKEKELESINSNIIVANDKTNVQLDHNSKDAFFLDNKQLCSKALYVFLKEYNETIEYFLTIIVMAAKMDEIRTAAAKALSEFNNEKDELRIELDNNSAMNRITKYRTIQMNQLVNATVNNFLCYLSDVIQLAIRENPEILKSQEQIKLEEILSFRSYNEILDYIIDKKLTELSYQGIDKIQEYISNRLGIKEFCTSEQKTILKITIESRNIISHNRGIINDIFLSRTNSHERFKFQKGEKLNLRLDDFEFLALNCLNVTFSIDQMICDKFKIKRKRFSTWSDSQSKHDGVVLSAQ